MNYIRQHWFGMSVSAFMAYFLLVFIMVAISPQNDTENRGFIPCSQKQTEKIINCTKNKAFCIINAAVRGNFCYMKVFNLGLWNFVSGKQPRPWSNYLFKTKIDQTNNEEYQEELNKLLEENPNLIDGIEDLKEKNRELMERINKNQGKVHHDEE